LRPGGKNSWSLGDLNVTVGADLRARRAPGDPVRLRGDVTTIRGVYSFESRRFEIQRGGRIRFQDESPLDPTFDVRGVRTIQGVEARVDVRGRLSAPQLELGSNVPLDEADVLSMIIFNRPVNQLGDTQRADLVGAAASLAGGFVTAPLARSLGRALDLDLLEVEAVTFGQNVAPRVRVGQQLTSRLFVQLSQQFGAESVSELTGEYQLAKFLRLQASTAQGPGSRAQRSLLQRAERFGLDLLFFFNY
jgi:translocation and assembly module TamB